MSDSSAARPIGRSAGSAGASRSCPACSRWPTCSAATRASSTRCVASTRPRRRSSAVAIVLDMLDGRIARLTGTASDFGVAVRFARRRDLVRHRPGDSVVRLGAGAARPARLGGGLRLRDRGRDAARAVQHPEPGGGDKRYFVGMPSPAAAAIPAATVFFYPAGAVGLSRGAAGARDGARARAS